MLEKEVIENTQKRLILTVVPEVRVLLSTIFLTAFQCYAC